MQQRHVLSAADLAEAREELQRQLLDDTAAAEVASSTPRIPAASGGIAIAILLPLAAVGLYALLGSPAAVLPEDGAETSAPRPTWNNSAAKLAQQDWSRIPDNPEGWAMLARSYKSLGRWDDAERAYGRIGPDLEQRTPSCWPKLRKCWCRRTTAFDATDSRELIQQGAAARTRQHAGPVPRRRRGLRRRALRPGRGALGASAAAAWNPAAKMRAWSNRAWRRRASAARGARATSRTKSRHLAGRAARKDPQENASRRRKGGRQASPTATPRIRRSRSAAASNWLPPSRDKARSRRRGLHLRPCRRWPAHAARRAARARCRPAAGFRCSTIARR
jgi:hypothetical protein